MISRQKGAVISLGLLLCVNLHGVPSAEQRLHWELVDAWQLPEGPDRWRHEARLWFYAGTLTTEKERKGKCFALGKESAEQLRAALPRDPGGLFWYAANLSGQVEQARNLWALTTMPVLESTLLELVKEKPHFGHGGAHRVLGVIYEAAPGFISIGSSEKAETHLRLALKEDPSYPGNQIAWAEWLAKRGRRDEARKALGSIPPEAFESDYGIFWPERTLWERDMASLEDAVRREVP